MKLLNFFGAAAAAVWLGLAGAATAATLGAIPDGATNEGLVPVYGAGTTSRKGYYGANVSFFGSANTAITIEWLGAEAGFKNEFSFDGGLLFTTTGTASTWEGSGSTATTVSSGLLNFSFKSPLGIALNGANPDNTVAPGVNFFASIDGGDGTATSGKSIVLWFDDDGANNDDNHDDMAIRLTVKNGGFSVIPVPASALLLLGGLGGLAAFRRRKS